MNLDIGGTSRDDTTAPGEKGKGRPRLPGGGWIAALSKLATLLKRPGAQNCGRTRRFNMRNAFMKLALVLFLSGALALALAGQTAAGSDDPAMVRPAVVAVFDTHMKAINTLDAELWLGIWDEDGVKMVANAPPIVGKPALAKFIRAKMPLFATRHIVVNIERVVSSGDLATASGTYVSEDLLKSASAATRTDGWFSTVLRRQPNGEWKMYRDSVGSTLPPGAGVAAQPPSPNDTASVRAAISDVFATYVRAVEALDAELWLGNWDEDGVKMVANAPPIVGKAAIAKYVRAKFPLFDSRKMVCTLDQVVSSGGIAVANGTYTSDDHPRGAAVNSKTDGWFSTVFRRQADGSWKILRDSVGSNVAPR
jgi:ketosteroid isomerase-like protein